jgi:hypothetical protein
MASCVRLEWLEDANGAAIGTGPVLMIDTSAMDVSTCQYVLQSGAEVANSPYSLSAADGAYLAGSVVGCWMAAYAVRVIINVIKGSTEA